MSLLPAFAEPAANAGIGPEGHRRTSSAESGALSDATLVAADMDGIDDADVWAVDDRHKSVAIEKAPASPQAPCAPKRAAISHKLTSYAAKRGRVRSEMAPGPPALTTATTNSAGSPTTAAPMNISTDTATAFAVADPNVSALKEPDEAPDAGDHDGATTMHGAAAPANGDDSAAAGSSAGPELIVAPHSPASLSRVIAGVATVGRCGIAPASPSATTPTAAHHISALCSSSNSTTIVANPTSRGYADCPPTPVISRLPVPRSHATAGSAVPALPAAGSNGQISALRIGVKNSATSTPAPAHAVPRAHAVPPTSATALTHFGLVPQPPLLKLPERIAALCQKVVQRGMNTVRNTMLALFRGDSESTNGHQDKDKKVHEGAERAGQETYGDQTREWDEDAHIDAALLELLKRQCRRFL